MTKSVQVIIGAGYGDEGKGLITDYLASKMPEAWVVRFNGGAQAGHTVETPDGKRHVFSHYGSGTLVGLPTYLSKYFVCSPMEYIVEKGQLFHLDIEPELWIDPECLVTTPYDLIINQAIERKRNKDRHGSVGVGFNETIERSQTEEFKIVASDLNNHKRLVERAKYIADNWIPIRCKQLGLEVPKYDMDVLWDFTHYSNILANNSNISKRTLSKIDHLIFEGAQGLLLDQDSDNFPHVTRSSTGIKNVLELTKDMELERIDTYYVTRPYVTKHGAGSLQYECDKPYKGIVEKTNVTGEFQGQFRYGLFNRGQFINTIRKDIEQSELIVPHIAMTCVDQLGLQPVKTGDDGNHRADSLVHHFQNRIFARDAKEHALMSFGPTRDNIEEL